MNHKLVQDPLVVVLADGETTAAVNHAKGHLFERFTANLMHLMGFENPKTTNLNSTSSGIELDIRLRHQFDGLETLGECKCYTTNVSAAMLSAFYGKLRVERFDNDAIKGVFVAIPRLTAPGNEMAEKITKQDQSFRVITAVEIWSLLLDRGQIKVPCDLDALSDLALIIHDSGTYSACLEIDPENKTAARVLIKAKTGVVNVDAIRLLSENSYAQGLEVTDASESNVLNIAPRASSSPDSPIVRVAEGKSDFEYQLPAAPKFFVGRRNEIKQIQARIDGGVQLVVLNAQSGWGKSSLALKVAADVNRSGGYGVVLDARTANSSAYIPSVLRYAAEAAEKSGLFKIGAAATWASLTSAMKSIDEAVWTAGSGRLLMFFDQFENVFKDEEITRSFRDLSLAVLDCRSRIIIGFAWKTDFVGWTENHPYQLRDEIRNSAALFSLEPFGPKDVDTIIARLQRDVGKPLSREIRQRLREYSQGLPWLLKKLAGHLIQELSEGKSQEQLVAEALNVANLFESDLANLSPSEQETLNFIASYAPIQAGEVTERFSAGVVQSLLDQRLIIQVGEKLDTYWDTFKDYLNTGNVPIEDSYILRQTPGSVARLLTEVVSRGGEVSILELASAWSTSENAVFNVARELRQLGLALYKPNQVQLIGELITSSNIEEEVRRRVARSLRRHKAFSLFTRLAERGQGSVVISQFSQQLANVFPAVEVTPRTWTIYARVFLSWFEYAGLVVVEGPAASVAPDGYEGKGALTSTSSGPRTSGMFPSSTCGPSLAILKSLLVGPQPMNTYISASQRRRVQQLLVLGAVTLENGLCVPIEGLCSPVGINTQKLRDLLGGVLGGDEALDLLRTTPDASQLDVGLIFREAYKADWKSTTTSTVGKSFRGWAKAAGVPIVRTRSVR